MRTFLPSILVVGLLGSGLGVTYAADPYPTDAMAGKETSPSLKERLTEDTITGPLIKTEGEYYFIQADRGLQRIHVDKSTQLDSVKPGDMVRAYVTDQGHTTTLQRLK
ncbi:MAG: hypothetical protein H8K03_19805 [Nitrospira sp.]|jgi:hypothetical protein|nr:hypothetical protein [Nitrospira sp. BO4]